MSSTNQFQVSLERDGRWLIEIRPNSQTNDVYYLSYDGTNTYCVEYLMRTRGAFGPDGRPQITIRHITEKTNYSGINPGEYPLVGSDEQYRSKCLWLCLVAGHYMRNTGVDSMPLPWEDADRSLTAYGFRVESELCPDPPYSPQRLEFIRSIKLDLPDLDAELKRPNLRAARREKQIIEWNKELEERKNFFPDGFVAGKLESHRFTNRYGFTIPLAFSCKVLAPGGGDTNNSICLRRYDGQVIGIEEYSREELFKPPIIAPLQVRDERFRYRDSSRGIDRIDYVLQGNEEWPSQNSPKLKSLFSAALTDPSSKLYNPFRVRVRRIATFVSIAVLGTLLPFILYKLSKRNRRQKTTT